MTLCKVCSRLKNNLSELETLSRDVDRFGRCHGLSEKSLFEINVALEELFTNIVSYGYPDNAEDWISVTLSLENGTLIMCIEDEGIPFNPAEADSPGLECSLEDRQIGRLGIFLAKHFVDEIAYQRCGDRNVVVMKKNL